MDSFSPKSSIKMLALLLVASVLLQLSTQQEVPGILQKRASESEKQAGKRAEVFSAPESCDGTRMFSTCSGCNDVTVCLGDTMDWRYCPYVTPDKPYCNNGACSATPSFNDYCPASLYCTGSGIFPDPKTCEIYHVCEYKYSMSDVYKCPQNYVFNPETTLCKRKQHEGDCMKVQCNPEEIFSSYGSINGTSKRFFGYCRFNGQTYPYQTEIYRCPEGTQFDGKTCSFQCPGEGRFPDNTDPRNFYECYYSGDVLTAFAQVCPYGKVFNSQLYLCVTAVSSTTSWPTTTGYSTTSKN